MTNQSNIFLSEKAMTASSETMTDTANSGTARTVARWTASDATFHPDGGFVAVMDYQALERKLSAERAARVAAEQDAERYRWLRSPEHAAPDRSTGGGAMPEETPLIRALRHAHPKNRYGPLSQYDANEILQYIDALRQWALRRHAPPADMVMVPREPTPEQWQDFYDRVWDCDETSPVLSLTRLELQRIGKAMLAAAPLQSSGTGKEEV